MKFSEMPYARPDLDELKQQLQALTDQLKSAPDYASAHEAFLAQQKLSTHIDTLATLSSVRNSIDTRDKFYDAEEEFWNEAGPELRAYDDAWTAAMLESPFRKEFAAEYGDLMFLNAEIARKAFSPAIVEELKQENQLVQDYQKLIASAQIEFEGGTYTISQLSPFKNDPDDARRCGTGGAAGPPLLHRGRHGGLPGRQHRPRDQHLHPRQRLHRCGGDVQEWRKERRQDPEHR